MAYKTYIGFEIEAVYNSQLLNLNIGEYHNGIKCGKYWTLERDGSIKANFNNEDWKNWGSGVEAVSIKLDSKNKVKAAFKEFKDIFSKKGQYELNKAFCFNHTVGLHIHISYCKNGLTQKFNKFIDPSVFKKLRRRLFKDIKNSKLKCSEDILNNYFRGYANKTRFDEQGNFRFNGDKYQEFNFNSERNNQGLEWRSPNLNGVKTWEEFEFMINLYLKYVYFMIKKLIRNKTEVKEVIEIEDKEQQPNEIKINLSPPMPQMEEF